MDLSGWPTRREQYAQYRQDQAVLAEIGTCLAVQPGRTTVCLPGPLAVAAVAAWDRDDPETDLGQETGEERAVREDAGTLALIGLAVSSRGVWDGETVTVELHPEEIGAAVAARTL